MILSDLLDEVLEDNNTYIVEGLKLPKFPIILGATVFKDKVLRKKYKLSRDQKKLLKDIYKTYGDDVAKAILQFKKKIVDPFNKIRSELKGKRRVSSKDITGLTKEQFESALESGRKKIEARGDEYFDKVEAIQERLNKYKRRLSVLSAAKKEIRKDIDSGAGGSRQIDHNIMAKVYKEFDVALDDDDLNILGKDDSDTEGASRIDRYDVLRHDPKALEKGRYKPLRKYTRYHFNLVFNRITEQYQKLLKAGSEANRAAGDPRADDLSTEKITSDLKTGRRLRELWKGQNIDLIKSNRGEFYVDNKFNQQLGKYFFSRQILDKLRTMSGGQGLAPFKKTYVTAIEETEKNIAGFRERALQDLITLKKNVKFTEKEDMVWEKRKTAEDFSNRLEDYVQKVKEEDFLQKPVFIERSPEMKQAEEAVENETRRFVRKISSVVDSEDLKKLKDSKLISKSSGGSIEINKLESNMFNSNDYIKKEVDVEDDIESREDDDEDGYLSPDQYHIRLRQIANLSYESVSELNQAKKEAKDLYDKMVDQGDKKEADEYKNLLDQIKFRKSIKAGKIRGEGLTAKEIIDINDIQEFLERMLKKRYKSPDAIRADDIKLNNLINRLRRERGSEAERDLEDIQFLKDQWARKRTDYDYSKESR